MKLSLYIYLPIILFESYLEFMKKIFSKTLLDNLSKCSCKRRQISAHGKLDTADIVFF